MSLGRYSILVLGVALATLLLAWPLALRRLDAPASAAVGFGVSVALLNTIAARHVMVVAISRRQWQALVAFLEEYEAG